MFQQPILPQCPQCKENSLKIIESKKSKQSTRRRKQCTACGYRTTTHEVSVDFFEEAKHNLILVAQMRKLLGADLPIPGVEPPPSGVSVSEFRALNKCSDCQHNKDGCYCAFEFPEYDTAESYDCNHFQLFKSK
jgi:hypothetical protein